MSNTPITDRESYAYGMDDTEVVPIETARQLERMCAELASVLGEPMVTNEWLGRRAAVLARWQAMKEQK